DKLALQNFVIAQAERAETAGDPAQAFAGWMRIARVRIGSPHNFAEQKESWIGQLVFFQNGIERDVFAVMTEFAVRHVENNSDVDLGPVRVVRQKNKFGFPVDKIFDQPGAGDAIDFNFLASDPFHSLDFLSWRFGSGMRSRPPFFMARIRFS